MSAAGIVSVHPAPLEPGAESNVALAASSVAYRISVGTAVAMSSSTGQTGAVSSALMSELLPCLNSPTTWTVTVAASSSRRAVPSRSARSGRS